MDFVNGVCLSDPKQTPTAFSLEKALDKANGSPFLAYPRLKARLLFGLSSIPLVKRYF